MPKQVLSLSDVSAAPSMFRMREIDPALLETMRESIRSRLNAGQSALIHAPAVYPREALALPDHPTPFVISAGNHRTEGLRQEGIQTYEFEVEQGDTMQFMRDVYEENTEREEVNPVDEAFFLLRMYQHGQYADQNQFAQAVGQHPSVVSRKMALVNAPERLIEMLRFRTLDLTHAYDILSRTKGSKRIQERVLTHLMNNLVEEPVKRGYVDGEERVQQRIHLNVQQLRRHIDLEMINYSPEKEALLVALAEEVEALAQHYDLPVTQDLPEYPEFVSVEDALELNTNPTAQGKRYREGVGLQVSEVQKRIVVSQTDARKLTEDLILLQKERSGEGNEKLDADPTGDQFNEKGEDENDGDEKKQESPTQGDNPYETPQEQMTDVTLFDAKALLSLSNNAALKMLVLSSLSTILIHGGQARMEQLARLLRGRVDGAIVDAIEDQRPEQVLGLQVKSFELPIMAAMIVTVLSDMAEKYGLRWTRQVLAGLIQEKDEPAESSEAA